MVKENITVRIEPEMVQALDKIAEENYRTRSNVINIALKRLVLDYRKKGSLSP